MDADERSLPCAGATPMSHENAVTPRFEMDTGCRAFCEKRTTVAGCLEKEPAGRRWPELRRRWALAKTRGLLPAA